MFVLFLGLRRSWPGMALRCSTGHIASLMGLVPITHRELNRAVMVLGTVRALMYAPFALAVCVAGVAGMKGGFNWLQAVYLAWNGGSSACSLIRLPDPSSHRLEKACCLSPS